MCSWINLQTPPNSSLRVIGTTIAGQERIRLYSGCGVCWQLHDLCASAYISPSLFAFPKLSRESCQQYIFVLNWYSLIVSVFHSRTRPRHAWQPSLLSCSRVEEKVGGAYLGSITTGAASAEFTKRVLKREDIKGNKVKIQTGLPEYQSSTLTRNPTRGDRLVRSQGFEGEALRRN